MPDLSDEDIAERITQMHAERQSAWLLVTRETVQRFLDDGVIPVYLSDKQGLAIFLLQNRLYGALSWMVAQSADASLQLGECSLGDEAMESVGAWLKEIPFPVRLDLRRNSIGANGVAHLGYGFRGQVIRALDLSDNRLGDEGIELLCAGLSHNASLQSLSLMGVGGGDTGIRALAGVLDTHPSLARLNLNSNAFDDAAAAVLAAALRHNRVLTGLSLQCLNATDTGLCAIASALATNAGLQTLRLSLHNLDSVNLVLALADAVAVNRTLIEVDVHLGAITDQAAGKLAAAVMKNSALRFFDCHQPDVGISKALASAKAQIADKIRANALVEDAGDALSMLSRQPEWPVPVPPEVGQAIAASVVQVAEDNARFQALLEIVFSTEPLVGARQ